MQLVNGLPAMPPVPLELLFPEPATGKQLVEASAPRFIGDPACPVCHAMLHYTHQGGHTYRAVCSRSDHATRLQTEPKHLRRCRWLGWLVVNPATKLMLIVGHGETQPPDAVLDAYASFVPLPSLP